MIRSVGFGKGPIRCETEVLSGETLFQRIGPLINRRSYPVNRVSLDRTSCFIEKTNVFAHLEQHVNPMLVSCLIADFLLTNGPRGVVTCTEEQHVPDSINHSFDLMKLLSSGYPGRNVGGNQPPDGSVCLSQQNPSITNGLPVDTGLAFARVFPRTELFKLAPPLS